MKKILIFLLVLLAVPLSTFASTISELDPVSHWTMDEDAGVRYDSVVLSGNDLSDINTVATTSGLLNFASDFESTNVEALSISDSNQSYLDFVESLSFSAWINFESKTADKFIFSKGDVNSGSRDVAYWLFYNGVQLEFRASDDGTLTSTHNVAIQSPFWSPTLNQWYHLVFRFDVVTETGEFFIDGTSLGVPTKSGSMGNVLRDSTDMFILGARENAGSYTSTFDGFMDEVTLFSEVISTSTIVILENGGSPLEFNVSTGQTSLSHYLLYTNEMVSQIQCIDNASGTTCVPQYELGFDYFFQTCLVFLFVFFAVIYYFKRPIQI